MRAATAVALAALVGRFEARGHVAGSGGAEGAYGHRWAWVKTLRSLAKSRSKNPFKRTTTLRSEHLPYILLLERQLDRKGFSYTPKRLAVGRGFDLLPGIYGHDLL